MNRTLIYLDESGDLGWTLNAPYQNGGSSRMLTLAAICIPESKSKYVQRIMRTLYKKRKRPLKNELKSVDLNYADKQLFIQSTLKMLKEHEDIELKSITVNKRFVDKRMKSNPNILYNYMVKLLLLPTLCQSKYVDFIPDQRSEKVNARWNMGEYLIQMIYEEGIEKNIINQSCNITPMDSQKCLELQFIDIYAGMVWASYEFEKDILKSFAKLPPVTNRQLFFKD